MINVFRHTRFFRNTSRTHASNIYIYEKKLMQSGTCRQIQYFGWDLNSAVVEGLRNCGSLLGRDERFIIFKVFGETRELTSPPRQWTPRLIYREEEGGSKSAMAYR